VTSDGLVTASYAADEGLLGELRAQWPPGPSPLRAASDGGYLAVDLTGRPPAAAVRLLGERYAIALFADVERWLSIPLAGFGGRWWQAAAGDGLSAFVAGVPSASELAIGVDQTNDSVIVGERIVVKWFRGVGPGPSRAARLVAHLDAAGFRGMPRPLGTLTWRTPGGVELTLAGGDAYLAGARDGWEWAVERVGRGEPSAAETGRQLGRLVGDLGRALATPTAVIPNPRATATESEVEAWHRRAIATLEEAIGAAADEGSAELLDWAPRMRVELDGIQRAGAVTTQPIHGDLHVGQVLEWPGGLAVIDFDGNPALGDAANAVVQPPERDLAQLLMSLDHVARIVERDRGGDRSAWVAAARGAFLDALPAPPDPALLAAFEVEQECRELVYAARFLPRWRFAPLAALRARYR
jgi:maltokinase